MNAHLKRLNDHMRRVIRLFGYPAYVGSHRFRVRGYISNILDVNDTHEPDILRVIERLLQRPGVFIDVGANLGQTLGKVINVHPGRAYIGFEPQIAACHFVDRFIRDNDLRNAKVLPIGLGSENLIKKFYSLGDADVMASLERSDRHTDETVIQTRRGDEVLQELEINQIAAIKIDVEGAELDVLNGLRKTLSLHRPPVLFEVLPNFDGAQKISIDKKLAEFRNKQADNLLRFWENIGFDIYQIDEFGGEIPIKRFDLEDRNKFVSINYLARYRED